MPRRTLTRSLFGVVALTTLVGTGCDQWLKGAAVSCKAVVNASGATCKSCVDASGASVSEACDSVPVGSGGTSGSGPGSDPGACITLSEGGPTSCKDAATWMKYGTESCAQQKLTLTDLKPVTTCAGGNYESVTYVCLWERAVQRCRTNGAGHHVRRDDGRQRQHL